MHDYDKIQTEDEAGEFGFEMNEDENLNLAGESPIYGGGESPFSEIQELELASELLGVSNEEELESYLGNVIQAATRVAKRELKPHLKRVLGGLLKSAARHVIPLGGSTVGKMIEGPIGSALGDQLSSKVSSLFGLELEGLSNEDREFEVARRFTQFAGHAARHAAKASPNGHPQTIAKQAVLNAARKHAPGFVPATERLSERDRTIIDRTDLTDQEPSNAHCNCERSVGRWVRHGHKIILIGA